MSNTYDYIVGASAAGSVIATRLATARRKTLLLEGGEDTREGQGVMDSFNKFTWETGSIGYYFAGWSGYPIDLKTYTNIVDIIRILYISNITFINYNLVGRMLKHFHQYVLMISY
jgi:hypothetical protein